MFPKFFLRLTVVLLGGCQFIKAGVIPRSVTCSDGSIVTNEACCQLFPVMTDLQALFGDLCSQRAHRILHLAFHDAIGISPVTGGGGADGSILTFNDTEGLFHPNMGLQVATALLQQLQSAHNISDGDLLHFAAAVAISSCPGAPRMSFLLGRPPAKAPSPDNLIPEPFDSVQTILERFETVGFSESEVVALLAAHSIAANYETDPSVLGAPLDSTPGVFDTQIFIEVQLRGTTLTGQGAQGTVFSALAGELRLQSDDLFARDSATNCLWQSFAGNQARMQTQFQAAMSHLQRLGQNTSNMIDCSEVIPTPPPLPSPPHLPAGLNMGDIEQACATAVFPSLSTLPGPLISVSPQECVGTSCWLIETTSSTTTSTVAHPATSSTGIPSLTLSTSITSKPTTTASSPLSLVVG